MEQRPLGGSGLNVSVVGLGCSNFGGRTDAEAARRIVHKALDLGVTFFDTADVYGNRGGSESCLGDALGVRRKDIVLATKFGRPMDDAGQIGGASRGYIMVAVEASLRRLKTDWIDLYQVHWPDPATPVEETLRALEDLVRQGKIRAAGASNFAATQIADAHESARQNGLRSFASAQSEYSLLVRDAEHELLPALQRTGAAFLPYLPLAGGLLSGKYQREATPDGARFAGNPADGFVRDLAARVLTESNKATVERLETFAAARGRRLIELAVSWLAGRPGVASLICGATRPEQVEQNVAAAGWKFTTEDNAEIERLLRLGA